MSNYFIDTPYYLFRLAHYPQLFKKVILLITSNIDIFGSRIKNIKSYNLLLGILLLQLWYNMLTCLLGLL